MNNNDPEMNRNTILAIVISLGILIVWQIFFGFPEAERARKAQEEALRQQQLAQQQTTGGGQQGTNPIPAPDGSTAVPNAIPSPGNKLPRESALALTERVTIDTPRVRGSISLTGGRIDDIVLKDYRVTIKPNSPNITLLSPSGSESPYFAEFGWIGATGSTIKLPNSQTLWTKEKGDIITPNSPVTLKYDNGEGLIFRNTFSIDENYMISIKREVENTTTADITLFPYAQISRHGLPSISGFFISHEGLIGLFGENGQELVDYSDIVDDGTQSFNATSGWIGITDKYWASILIPDQEAPYFARMSQSQFGATPVFHTDYRRDAITIGPGISSSVDGRLFAGAKETNIIDDYEIDDGVTGFELLIDWGWFYFLTKPMFYVIDWLFKLVGNFGVAILLVTVIVKLVFFPLANKSYISMSKMKLLQPEMLKIRERYSEDKMKQQQEMMALYKKEKVNPMSGCLPILLQIPVFFALYKVLFITIEMRHAPFFGWIQDLAAPDPTSIFNMFGLFPWGSPFGLVLGIWPIIMGITMFLQMRLNPTPPDPIQAQIFNWMPVVFTVMLASFPAGLVIYWAWNNTLSIIQQAVIMKRQGVKIELWDNLTGMFSKKKPAEEKSE